MKLNVGLFDRTLRVIIGVVGVAAAVYFRSWWGIAPLEVGLVGLFGWSPMYWLLGLSTVDKTHRYIT